MTARKKAREKALNPSDYHRWLMDQIQPALSFTGQDFSTWQGLLRSRLMDLIGWLPDGSAGPPEMEMEKPVEKEGYLQYRLVYRSEPFADVPAYLLIPAGSSVPLPVMICLQGHSPGVHISIGEARTEHDAECISGDRDYAVQAVRNGFAAFAIEQRAFGERSETRQEQRSQHGCHDATMHSLMLGRTLIGERVGDVMRGIDLLQSLAGEYNLDLSRLACMGNSGGGTITFFSSIADERIRLSVPSCYFCTFRDSIMQIYHCADNYVPRLLMYAEMYDLAGLIAPRHLLIVAGKQDPIFPIEGVRKAYLNTKEIYAAAGAADRIRLFVGDEGHRFYRESWKHITDWVEGAWS